MFHMCLKLAEATSSDKQLTTPTHPACHKTQAANAEILRGDPEVVAHEEVRMVRALAMCAEVCDALWEE